MTKSIKLSLIVAIAITSLNAEIITQVFTNPLPGQFKATDNGLHEVARA